MSKLNKLVTNYPVELTEEEVENLSATLAPVVAACGGGGGTGGKIYTGIGFVSVNNTTNQIGLTNEANTKLNQDIPTKVSDLTDSANYQTVAGMDEYLTTANAQTLYQTKEAMSAYWTSAETTEVFAEELSTLVGLINGKQDKLTFAYDNDKISAINGSALAGQGGVTGDYYSASNPSGFINSVQAETQILEKHYLTEASGNARYIPIPEGLSDNQYYAYTTSSWKVIQGAGDVSGISTVAHDDTLTGNGNNENLGVDITKIQTKLTDAEIQNITDVTTLKTASATWDNVSAKLDSSVASTTYQTKADMEGYLTKSEASTTYQPTGNYLVADDITGKLDKSIYSNASGNWENTYNVVNQYSAAGTWLTEHQSLTDYYTKSQTSGATELSTEFGKYALKSEIPTVPTKVSDLTDSANYYKTTETSSKNELSIEFAKYLTNTQYNTDSATFALKSDLNGLVNSASVTTNDNYVMTNTGWKVLTLPGGGMTQVYHDTTLTGDGNANNNQLGVKWETLSSNTIAYSNSAFNLTNGTSVSSFDQISASIDSRYSKTASDGRYLQKSLDDTLTGDGTSNKKLGVAWSALSGNTIASAEKAGEAQGFRWGDNTYQDTSAALTNLWNAKNHVTLQTANNILTVDNNDNTSATLSAMSYVVNPNNAYWKPQRSCVCTEDEISTMAGYANGQGMLFFVVSGHNQ